MSHPVARRGFLKAIPAAGMLAYADPPAPQAKKAADFPISQAAYTPADYPIRPKRYSEVQLRDAFWAPRIRTNAEVTIPFEFEKLGAEARGLNGGVLEAAIFSLATHPDPKLQAWVDARVATLAKAAPRGNGEFEIAATYFTVTGKRDLLDPSVQAASALYTNFETRNPPFSGGERDALNCVRLFQVTREKKHLDLAKHYLDIRGLADSAGRSRHNQSYKPVLEQSEAVGHAVNCVTLMLSLVEVGVLTGLRPYFDAGHRLWEDAVTRKLYITGGVGSTGNEGFGEAYSLPNINAYAETCAVLMFLTLNHRLFLATGDSRYIDVMERGMYNNAIDGVSLAGNRFFYVNRLASAGDGRDTRWERASLECCPPNLVRFLASMPGLIYAQDQYDAIFVNLYVSSEASFQVNKKEVRLAVDSAMPWGGKSTIRVAAREPVKAALKLRIPGWARNQPAPGGLYSYPEKLDRQTTLSVNGKTVPATVDANGYVALDREWRDGDAVEINFPFETRRVAADQRVHADRSRVAVERGPIVYCCEGPDVAGGHVLGLQFDRRAPLKSAEADGVTVVQASARSASDPAAAFQPVTLIPYHRWANRGAAEMAVWLPVADYQVGDTGPSGGIIIHVNPNYAKDGWRYLEAAPFDQSAGAKWGCFRKAIAGARGTAVGTGKQNTADMLAACNEPDSAAGLCANLSLNGVSGWFLPSRDELALLYKAGVVAASGPDNFTYWASSQQTADMAAHIDFADGGRQHGDDKDFPRRVRAIRSF